MYRQTSKSSLQAYARLAGALYLIIIATGLVAEMFIRKGIVVSGDVAATAHHLMAAESRWRTGIFLDIVMHLCDVPVMVILYVLLRPVNTTLALMNLLFTGVQTAAMVATKVILLLPLFLLGNSPYLHVFTPAQLQTLSYVAINADSFGFGIGLMFFGFTCLVEGYLIYKSGFLPALLGRMLQVGGLCYLINSTALLLAPDVASWLFPAILLPSFVAELSLSLWLVVKGVNVAAWQQRVNPGLSQGFSEPATGQPLAI